MNEFQATNSGFVSCCGLELRVGTLCRLACRRVLDALRPTETVTLCLPLFIAGGEEERTFAARYPTITVDGCAKLCAAKATEMLSGKPRKALRISDILQRHGIPAPTKLRQFGPEETPAVEAVAAEIASAVDEVLAEV